MERIQFKQLKYVLAVAEERSISAAAKKLSISQPSLSQFIQKVEENIGMPLFDRSVSPLKLTEIGNAYIKMAKKIMELATQFENQVDDMLDFTKGKVVIGSSPFRSIHLLSKILPIFKEKYPNIDVLLTEHNTYNLEELVQQNEVDFAISLLPVDKRIFDFEPLFDEKILLALPPLHPLAKNADNSQKRIYPKIQLSQLKETNFIQMNKGHRSHYMLLDLCKKAGFSPNVILETNDMTTSQTLVSAGMGAALLPEGVVSFNSLKDKPKFFELEQQPQRTVAIIYRKGHYLSKAARAFIDVLKENIELR